MKSATVSKRQNKIDNMDISEKHINNNTPIHESFNKFIKKNYIFSYNMREFGNYLMYIICALEMILASCSGYETNKFENDMISLHNTTRKLHSANYLILDPKMSKEAMKVLKSVYLGEHPSLEDPINYNYRYLYYVSKNAEKASAKDVFLFWYSKGRDYDYNKEPEDTMADPFAQIVWKSTRQFGIASLHINGENLAVASYFPPGNVQGKYKDNVGRLITEAGSSSSS